MGGMAKDETQGDAEQPRYVIVAPTFNHGRFLQGVLRALASFGMTVIVVDDGSGDETAEVLGDWAAGGSERIAVEHPENRGKGAALRSGFAEAERRGFTHAATIDTDGQHDPGDLRALLDASRREPRALVVGARPRKVAGYPAAGRIGRWLSNRLVRIESGVRVDDSQSGMRVYPLAGLRMLGARAGRYAFETEVLTRAGWAGMSVVEVPIGCVYRMPLGRVSHFRITDRKSVV